MSSLKDLQTPLFTSPILAKNQREVRHFPVYFHGLKFQQQQQQQEDPE